MSSASVTICICCLIMALLVLLAMVGIALAEISGLSKRLASLEIQTKYTPTIPAVGDVHPFTPDATVSQTDVEYWIVPGAVRT